MEHAFLLFPWMSPIWFDLQLCIIPLVDSVDSCSQWLFKLLCCLLFGLPLDSPFITSLFVTLWKSWKGRNEFIFEGNAPNPLGTLHMIKSYVFDILESLTQENVVPRSIHPIAKSTGLWRPPRAGVLKINSDASSQWACFRGLHFKRLIRKYGCGQYLQGVFLLTFLWPK